MVSFFNFSNTVNQFNTVSKQYEAQQDMINAGERKVTGVDATKLSRYRAQSLSIASAKQNMLDAISLFDTTNTGLVTVDSHMATIRTAYEAGTDGLATSDDIDTAQTNINTEIGEIDDLASNTTYNGRNLLYGNSDFTLQYGINQGDSFNVYFSAFGATDQRGVGVRIEENSGGNDRGTIVEDLNTSGFALDELSVGSGSVASYDTLSYGVTATGLAKIDQISDNLGRMQAQVLGLKAQAQAHYDYMTDYDSYVQSAIDSLTSFDLTTEMARLEELQAQKESITSLITTVSESNAAVFALLP